VVEDLHPGDEGEVEGPRPFPEAVFSPGIVGFPVAGEEGIEAIAKGIPEHGRLRSRWGIGKKAAPHAAPQGNKPRCMFADLGPRDLTRALGTTETSRRDKLTEMGVAVAVHGEEDNAGAVVDGDFGPGDEVDAQFLGPLVGADESIDAIAIGECEGADAEAVGFLHEFVGVAGSFEEGVDALAPEGGVDS